MNKFKRAAQALRAYLGNDHEGKKFLDALVRIGNNTKSELDACKQEVERQKLLKEAAQVELDEAKKAELEAKQELTKERDLRTQAESRVKILEISMKPKVAFENTGQALNNPGVVKACVKKLIEWRSDCPGPHSRLDGRLNKGKLTLAEKKTIYMYDINEIINGSTREDFNRVGMFVCVMACVGYPCGLHFPQGTIEEFDMKSQESIARLFVPWWNRSMPRGKFFGPGKYAPIQLSKHYDPKQVDRNMIND